MRLESRKEGAFPKLSGRRVSGSCLCGAVELEIDFPAFWAWHDHSAASRRAHGAAYATYIGCWRKHARLAKGQRSIGSLSKRETAAISKPSAKNSINPTARTTTTSEHHNAPVCQSDWRQCAQTVMPQIRKRKISEVASTKTQMLCAK